MKQKMSLILDALIATKKKKEIKDRKIYSQPIEKSSKKPPLNCSFFNPRLYTFTLKRYKDFST